MKAVLDRHGYVLQLAVEKHVNELARNRNFPWKVHAYEVPVEIGAWTTRIDLIMENSPFQLYLACECKREDPAFGWFFARVPRLVSRRVTFDLFRGDGGRTDLSQDTISSVGDSPYHIGVVGKSGHKGDGTGSGRDQIEGAVTQALKGASGLLNFLVENHDEHVQGRERRVIPAVITTSRLFVTHDDITHGSLEDGLLQGDVQMEERPWLWYQYHASPHLLSDHREETVARNPLDATLNEFTRSIAVIRANGIEDFFEAWT